MIGDDIVVSILGVKGNQVRIGVHAPDHVAIHREEIYDRIQEEEGRETRSNGTADIAPAKVAQPISR